MENQPSKTFETLKLRLEDQLNRMKDLSIEEGHLKNENKTYQNLCEENMTALESQKTAMKTNNSKIYERRDNFCQNIYKQINDIEKGEVEDDEEIIGLELQECDKQVAYLKKLNANANLEMLVIKSELARAREEQNLVHEDRNEQEKLKEEIIRLHARVEQLESKNAMSDKRKLSQDASMVFPLPKRQFISNPKPPLNSPYSTDDEFHEEFRPMYTEVQPENLQFTNLTKVPTKLNECAKVTEQNKPKFVFKRAVNRFQPSSLAEGDSSKN